MDNMLVKDICMIVISFFSFLNSSILCYLTYSNIKILKEHNIKSVQPRCNIISSESDGIIKVSVYNYGHGLMSIDKIDIINKKTQSIHHSFIEIIPKDIKLFYYSIETQIRDVAVSGHIKLLEILRKDIGCEKYEKVKSILSDYKIIVRYHCVYDNQYSKEKDLDVLFGNTYRNNENDK